MKIPNGHPSALVLPSGVAVWSHKGLVRGHNEDSFGCDASGSLMVVADGIGGHERGERAAYATVQAVLNTFEREPSLPRAVAAAHAAVQRVGADLPMNDRRPGSTVVIAWHHGDSITVAHLGDSRAYLQTPKGLRRLTHDHSFGHALVRFVGKNDEPEIATFKHRGTGMLMLCSDGVQLHLTDKDISAILRRAKSAGEACTDLVTTALSRGGGDNITVVVKTLPE